MPEVSFAAGTENFCSPHPERIVLPLRDVLFGNGLPKAGPAGAGLEFGLRVEQDRVAADAVIKPIRVITGISASKGALGRRAARDFEIFPSQLLLPFGQGLLDFLYLGYPGSNSRRIELNNLDESLSVCCRG